MAGFPWTLCGATVEATYPWASAPPEHLNDGRATHESFVQLMDENGIEKAAAGPRWAWKMVGSMRNGE